jgi:CRP/FNR family cyclic AMP-dependent transcriptional regulator
MAGNLERHLSEHPFFAGLAPDALAFLAGCAQQRHFEKDRLLFQHGDRAQHFYLILSGRISREVPAIQGPALIMDSLGAGEVLGWSWLIPPYRWSFQARVEQSADLLEFDGVRVLERCEAEPAFGYAILKRFSELMSRRLLRARQRMIDEWNPPGFA